MDHGDDRDLFGLNLVHDSIIMEEKLTNVFAVGLRDDSTDFGMGFQFLNSHKNTFEELFGIIGRIF